MFLPSRTKSVIIFTGLACVLGLLFMRQSDPEEKKRLAEFQQYYRIYSLVSPDNLIFAGEAVPMNDMEVQERYDKELLTNVYWQSQTILMIKRANRFFPTIERILKANNIPDDFKYVALAESGLQNVTSPAGANGYWQFLDKTGKRYGLEITEEVDERLNIERSTEAACRYFKEAYTLFGSWALVAASYNMGIDGIKKQLEQQQVTNYYDLYLNPETARYVLRILAIKQIVEHPDRFGFYVAQGDLYPPITTTNILVDSTIEDLVTFGIQNGVNYKVLKLMNPWLKKPILTVASGKVYVIQIPTDIQAGNILKNDSDWMKSDK
jgi:membrane-bound lytic murein transglycosylase D